MKARIRLKPTDINWNTWALALLGLMLFGVYQAGKVLGWPLNYELLFGGFTWIATEVKGEWRRKHPKPEEPKP